MNIAVLGTGVVGKVLAGKLAALGHQVTLGTRDPEASLARREAGRFGEAPLVDWLGEHPAVRLATFAEAARHGELAFLATGGQVTLAAVALAGDGLDGKIVVDVTNPLDFSRGMPPTLAVCNDDSLGEQVQGALPRAQVVKALNTVNAALMVDPGGVGGGDHTLFVCGDDAGAKGRVTGLLREWFGWRDVIDLGDITNARGQEMLLPLWVRLYGAFGSPAFNFKVVR